MGWGLRMRKWPTKLQNHLLRSSKKSFSKLILLYTPLLRAHELKITNDWTHSWALESTLMNPWLYRYVRRCAYVRLRCAAPVGPKHSCVTVQQVLHFRRAHQNMPRSCWVPIALLKCCDSSWHSGTVQEVKRFSQVVVQSCTPCPRHNIKTHRSKTLTNKP